MGFLQFIILASINMYLLPFLLQSSRALVIDISDQMECSTVCESEYCSVAPFLRYGKYCGVGYTGCPGQAPCDKLDACCQAHDACIGNHLANYLNSTCNRNLLNCVVAYRASRARQFQGNTCNVRDVEYIIETTMKIALHI